jgi:hypothetical protein
MALVTIMILWHVRLRQLRFGRDSLSPGTMTPLDIIIMDNFFTDQIFHGHYHFILLLFTTCRPPRNLLKIVNSCRNLDCLGIMKFLFFTPPLNPWYQVTVTNKFTMLQFEWYNIKRHMYITALASATANFTPSTLTAYRHRKTCQHSNTKL